ncbi:hypothetical protein ANRL1_02326 [Anaerolineae bacterium]|nr:hypothetical protein ANRL1_02326 [Anaerolineae bacterium]
MLEGFVFAVGLAYFLALLKFAPEIFTPRCPICSAPLERREITGTRFSLNKWRLGWRRFSCTACLYFHRRPVIYRDDQVSKYETHSFC